MQELTLNKKGSQFWNLPGLLDLNDTQAIVVGGLLLLFLIFFICGICCCCRATRLAAGAPSGATKKKAGTGVNEEIDKIMGDINVNDGTGLEEFDGQFDTARNNRRPKDDGFPAPGSPGGQTGGSGQNKTKDRNRRRR